MTHLRRMWLTWLALPEAVRIGIFVAVVIFGMLLFAPAARAQDRPTVPVLTFCKDGKLVALQLIAPAEGVITIPIPPDLCAAKPKPKRETARKAGPTT